MESRADLQSLIRRAQQGDRASLERLLCAFRPQLEQWAERYADPESVTESTSDLVQEVSVRAWQRLDQFRGDDGDADPDATLDRFRAWIASIVRTTGLNALRDRRAQRRRPKGRRLVRASEGAATSTFYAGARLPAGEGPTPSAITGKREETERVRKALSSIADLCDREILRMRFFEARTLREISESLELSYDTVRERYRRNLRALERELEDLR